MAIAIENIRPLHKLILVERDKGEESYGHIIKPFDEMEKEAYKGTVVSASKKVSVKAGDRILFSRYVASDRAVFFGENAILVHEDDIFGVLHE